MDLLRNYQIRKELDLIDSGIAPATYDPLDLRKRIAESYQRIFNTDVDVNPPISTSMVNSPPNKSRTLDSHTSRKIRSIIKSPSSIHNDEPIVSASTVEVKSLNQESIDSGAISEIAILREQVDHLRLENVTLRQRLEQAADNHRDVSPEQLLQRINIASPPSSTHILEKKLEIYKQQIVYLSEQVRNLSGTGGPS